jgi:thiol:disulfide interchange protein DsbA
MLKWLIPFCFLFIQTAVADNTDPYAGKYDVLKAPQATNVAKGKIEVLELFWYGCPHCYSFKEMLDTWAKKFPQDVELVLFPAVFSQKWATLAKAYYTAEALDVVEKLHAPLFKAIHENHRNLNDTAELAKVFAENGVSTEEFNKVFNSFGVNNKLSRAMEITPKYEVSGVPALVINGKYRLSSEKTEGYENMLKIADYLIEKERKAMSETK